MSNALNAYMYETRLAFRGVLLPKTHGSTERLRRREQTGSI